MHDAPSSPALDLFLQSHGEVWKGRHRSRLEVLQSGFGPLDAALPGGGWPRGVLIEILPSIEGIGELRLSLPALRSLSEAGRRTVFIRPPHIPYAPALLQAGLSLRHIVWIMSPQEADAHWAAEQTLRARAAGAVLLWSDCSHDRNLRRLQVAAEASRAWMFLYRTPQARIAPSPAALRLALRPEPRALVIDLLKVRGGMPARVRLPLHENCA